MSEVAQEETNKKVLSPAQYWEWRTTITELSLAKMEEEKRIVELKNLQLATEIHAIRQQLFQSTSMEAARQEKNRALAEYERFKKVLEDSLGISLNNKIIDDLTFEVRDVPDDKKKTP